MIQFERFNNTNLFHELSTSQILCLRLASYFPNNKLNSDIDLGTALFALDLLLLDYDPEEYDTGIPSKKSQSWINFTYSFSYCTSCGTTWEALPVHSSYPFAATCSNCNPVNSNSFAVDSKPVEYSSNPVGYNPMSVVLKKYF